MQIVRGASPRPIQNYITSDDNGVNWIKIGDVSPNDKYITKTNEKITKEGAKRSRYLHSGNFILSNSMSFGRPYILKIDGCIHDGWIAMSDYEEHLSSGYLYEVLNSTAVQSYWKQKANNGGAMSNLNSDIVKDTTIPIPSLAEQERIVGILDTFTASIDNLKEQIAQRRRQYEHYRDQLLNLEGKPGVQMIPLKDVADIGTGSSNTNEGLDEGKYPFYTRGKEILWKNEYEFDETSIITAGDGVGVGKVFHFVSGKFALHQRAYRIHIKTEDINPRFIYYYMVSTFDTYIKMKSFFAAVTSVRKPMIFNYPIPKCSLSKQQRIVSILDTFEESIKNLEAQLEQRQKQYEYYRNKLLSFE